MRINNNFNVLPFYDSLQKQNSKKWYSFGQHYPLICPNNTILPFQFITDSEVTVSSNIEAVNVHSGKVTNLGVKPSVSKGTQADATYYIVKMVETTISAMPEGLHYLRINTDKGYLYSEEFTYNANHEECIKIEYWNENTLNFNSGEINFDDDFRFILYIPSTIGKPEYEFEEELTKRLGYKFIESQTSNKIYKFNFLAPEYICDAMRLIRLCDYIKLTTKFDTYNALSFAYEPKWQDNGDLAAVDVEFDTDCIIQKLESFNRRLKESFYNALLADIDEPVLFSTDTVAQYYTEFTTTSFIKGKLIRQLESISEDELSESINDIVLPIDNQSDTNQVAKKVFLSDVINKFAPQVDLSNYLPKSVWDSVFELRNDIESGKQYIYGKLPLVLQYGLTMYSGDGFDIPSIYEGLPIDQDTIYWENGVLKAKAGTEGAITEITSSMVISALGFTPYDSSNPNGYITSSSLNGYATQTWVKNQGYLTSHQDLSGYQPLITSSNKLAYSLISGVPTSLPASDVAAWAKAASKPSYAFSEITNKPTTLSGYGITDAYTSSVIDGKLSGYLPSSGGRMTGTIVVDEYTSFGQTGGWFYLGNPLYPLKIRSAGTTTINDNTLIHSGNIGSYKSGSADYISNSAYYYNGNVLTNDISADYLFGTTPTDNRIFPAFMQNHPLFGGQYADVLHYTGYCRWGATQIASEYNAINPRVAIRKYNQTRSDWGDWVEFITSANIGSYALKTDGSNLMTGYVAWNNGSEGNDVEDWNTIRGNGLRIISSKTSTSNAPWTYTTALHIKGRYGFQLASEGGDANKLYYKNISKENNVWKTIAFTDSNVASATKLQTPRSIWGQSFDGTGNVSGALDNCNWVRYYKGANVSGYIIGRGEEIAGGDGLGLWTYGNTPIFFGAGSVERMRITSAGNVGIGTANPSSKLHVNGDILATGGITMYSDQRKKTILNHVELSLKDIANAPLIEHHYNSDNKKTTHVGSIAQYWASMNDWFCKLDNEGYYTMEIQNAALASAISIARELDRYESKTDKEIKKLKKRICELEDEVERLKSA